MIYAGFDARAVEIMESVQPEPSPDFAARCRKALFWAIYRDGRPVGGVCIEGACIHVGSLSPCGIEVRRIVAEYLENHPALYAPIRPDNPAAIRLARGLGFDRVGEMDGFVIYRRLAS